MRHIRPWLSSPRCAAGGWVDTHICGSMVLMWWHGLHMHHYRTTRIHRWGRMGMGVWHPWAHHRYTSSSARGRTYRWLWWCTENRAHGVCVDWCTWCWVGHHGGVGGHHRPHDVTGVTGRRCWRLVNPHRRLIHWCMAVDSHPARHRAGSQLVRVNDSWTG